MSHCKPILCFADGISKKIVKESNSGFICDEDNTDKLIEAFKKFENLSKSKLNELGKNGLKYYNANFDDTIIYNKLDYLI